MTRALFISFFIGLILFKPVAQLSWEIWYAVNLEYVAEELCENQEEPELECNGKCYLMKQLAKAEAEQQDNDSKELPAKPHTVKEEQAIDVMPTCCGIHLIKEKSTEFFQYKDLHSKDISQDQFHPPEFLS